MVAFRKILTLPMSVDRYPPEGLIVILSTSIKIAFISLPLPDGLEKKSRETCELSHIILLGNIYGCHYAIECDSGSFDFIFAWSCMRNCCFSTSTLPVVLTFFASQTLGIEK